MGTQLASEYAAPSSHRSDHSNQLAATTVHLNATCAQSMQSQAPQQQPYYGERRSFGQMPAPAPLAVQQASMAAPNQAPHMQLQYQYHANVQANQPAGGLPQQPLAQAAGYPQYQPMQQQPQQSQYSSDAVNYLVQPTQQPQQQQQQQQWSSASAPFFYSAATQPSDQQFRNEPAQVAPPDCSPCGACQPGSPMSTQSPSPAAAATSILQTPMTPPNGIGQTGGTASSSGQSSSCGRMASPSGASSTISSSESVGNMSINLEQYISKRNERERSRVRNVNDAFDNLKNSLPLEMEKLSKRMSKVEILRTAISYIKNLEEVLGYKQQQARDDRAILQQQQQQQQQQLQQCANGPASSMIRKRPRSGSVGHLMRSSLSQHHQRLLHERALDCENSMRLAWRHDRPASSLSRHDLLMLDDEFAYGAAPGAAYLKRKLEFSEQSGYETTKQDRIVLRHEVTTNCRQDTFRQEQALVQNYRRGQQQQHQDQQMQHNLQVDHEMGEPGAGQSGCGFEEFNPNVRCYNERNFDNY